VGPARQLRLNQDFAQDRIHEDRITRWKQKEPFLICQEQHQKEILSIGFNHAKRIFKAKSNEVLLEIFAKRRDVSCRKSKSIAQ
jgi:hypothetical protein